jgi:RHS repeat-associated protein
MPPVLQARSLRSLLMISPLRAIMCHPFKNVQSRAYTSDIYHLRCKYSCGLLNNERPPDGKMHYDLFDNLDLVVYLTNSSAGNKDNSYDDDPSGQIKAQQEGEANPWKFAAGYLDSSTGLYKFGTRYYDPTLGRWTQQDPVGGSLGDLNSANLYTYADDDPVNATDPGGELTCFQSILTAIATIVGTAQIGEYLAAAALAAIAGPIEFLVVKSVNYH